MRFGNFIIFSNFIIFMRAVVYDTVYILSFAQWFYTLNDLPDVHFDEKKWEKNK